MGTSQSSSGSPSGVPMVPPWVPDAPQTGDQNNNDSVQSGPGEPVVPNAPVQPVPIAPRGRFAPSRTSLGRYAQTGSNADMRRGLGHYVNKGFGGSQTATRRFAGTSRTAGSLYGTLSAITSGRAAAEGSPLDPALLRGRSAHEIMDAVVEAIRPIDGTQDAEASRKAIRDALSEVLTRFPDADLLNLSEDQKFFAVGRYIALDVYTRFTLDVGNAVKNKAPSATTALSRLKEIRDYIKEEVTAALRQLRTESQNLNVARITAMAKDALQNTFQVFEGYI